MAAEYLTDSDAAVSLQQAPYSIPRLPFLLGFAGLLPFITLAAAAWLPDLRGHAALINSMLLSYSACILSFMGAVHWGIAMDRRPNSWQLGLSTLPALLAWMALNLPGVWSYSVLIVCFALLCIADSTLSRQNRLPSWYPALRVPLTTVVVLSLITAAFAMVA